MCGIVGYVGYRDANDYLLEGLRRLEYRGYDSAGIAAIDEGGELSITRTVGRIEALAGEMLDSESAQIGIGHTRWATHGAPTKENAHPHIGGQGEVTIVHNGVIENYQPIKERLQQQGYEFASATDSEIIAHLIASCLTKQDLANGELREHLESAVKAAVSQLQGTYGLVAMFCDHPDIIVAARLGSPLVIGVGKDEHFVASDASPLAGYTDKIVYLADHQVATITADSLQVSHRDQGLVQHDVQVLPISEADVSLSDYSHYMLKEIFEQPQSLQNAMRGRLNNDDATTVFGGLNLSPQELRGINRIILTACGTSYHAALVGEYLIEELARIPVEVEYASELRYRNPPVSPGTLVFSITQSGETADTLAAQREMKRKGHPTLSICNVVGSTIAQEADGGVYLHAGPEVGVASTKAYTSQCVVLAMLAVHFGRLRHLSYAQGRTIIEQLRELPDNVEKALSCYDDVQRLAQKYFQCANFLYLGRQYNFPTALEGALKLKEISYIHAEGYPAAEMKHGPIALVEDETPSVFLVPKGFVYDKVMSNLEEIKARGGPVIAIVGEGDTRVREIADDTLEVPNVDEILQPIVNIIPLQLLAYQIAVLRGCDVDKPRNLAKSVTVE
ncbi:MAG: glutamine--fructose-6-phosphate transaminase (isomerizing) [Pirellulaceae bacterium]|nr:glutamine--fructose-6-phosphate transaminase (isomerizing) [Pirellulaceae bacterium]